MKMSSEAKTVRNIIRRKEEYRKHKNVLHLIRAVVQKYQEHLLK